MSSINRSGIFGSIPPVTKIILVINIAVFLLCQLFDSIGLAGIPKFLSLYTIHSSQFNPVQLISHMFMHAGFWHIFMNMFGLFMFGRVLESVLGSKKFFILYFASGLGAAFLQLAIYQYQLNGLQTAILEYKISPSPDTFWHAVLPYKNQFDNLANFAQNYFDSPHAVGIVENAKNILDWVYESLLENIRMVGASGAIFGILAAFAMMFPNVELMLIFFPVPIKAKYFVPIYAVFELFSGVANFQGDNIAHFAHLGGAIVGFALIYFWKKRPMNIY